MDLWYTHYTHTTQNSSIAERKEHRILGRGVLQAKVRTEQSQSGVCLDLQGPGLWPRDLTGRYRLGLLTGASATFPVPSWVGKALSRGAYPSPGIGGSCWSPFCAERGRQAGCLSPGHWSRLFEVLSDSCSHVSVRAALEVVTGAQCHLGRLSK